MIDKTIKMQMAVFALVSATFTNIYITQPVLPILQNEFGVSTVAVSMTVSIVILGIVLSNLFFGYLADRMAIHPILLMGGLCVAGGGLVSAVTHDFRLLLAARMFQGLFIPALTTSLTAWLSRTLSKKKLNVVMGAYVSATVLGGLGGRLLGGWIHPPLHWRYAFVTAAVLIVGSMVFALVVLPRSKPALRTPEEKKGDGFLDLLSRRELLMPIACGASGLLMFQPIFNFLPYHLSTPPFEFSTEAITLIYMVYVLGIFLGPVAGNVSNRFGSGNILIAGGAMFSISLVLLLMPSVTAVVAGLLGVCAGFFTIHSVAVGLLNSKLSSGQGKANALYILFYYTGGWMGITGAGYAFQYFDWQGVIGFVGCFLIVPLATGILEKKAGDTAAEI